MAKDKVGNGLIETGAVVVLVGTVWVAYGMFVVGAYGWAIRQELKSYRRVRKARKKS